MVIRYRPNTTKALETIIWLARKKPGITVYHVVKCAFFADRWHLNRYGRPVIGDHYRAAPHGPLGDTIYGLLKGDLIEIEALDGNAGPLHFTVEPGSNAVRADRDARLDVFSESDIAALEHVAAVYADLSFGELRRLTHRDSAWRKAEDYIRYEDMIDDKTPDREEKVEELRETAFHAVF